jgi:hypothetical protein
MTTAGLQEQIQKYRTADARMKVAFEPVIAAHVHEIGQQAQANAYSPRIAGQEFEASSFLSGTVGFHELGFPHAGMVRAFEGDGVAPEPFHPLVYGGPGVSDAMTHPALGPAVEADRERFRVDVAAVVRKTLT